MGMSEEDFDQVIDVNLKGTFNMMRFVSRQMLRQRSGRIISMASVAVSYTHLDVYKRQGYYAEIYFCSWRNLRGYSDICRAQIGGKKPGQGKIFFRSTWNHIPEIQ